MSAAGPARADTPAHWAARARQQLRQGALAAAAQAASRAVALNPATAPLLHAVADAYERSGRHHDAVELLQSVALERIGDPNLFLRLGIALSRLGRFEEAVQALFAVLRRDPRSTAAFAQLGNVFQLLQMPEEARESFRNALALGRSPVEMAAAIVFTSLEASRWEQLAGDMDALDALVAQGRGQPVPFYCLNLPWDRRRLRAAAEAQAARVFAGIAPLPRRAVRTAGSRLRIGYVSSDFHEHATAYLIAGLLEHHDRARVDAFAYSYGVDDGSPMRRRIEAAFGAHFVEAGALDDAALAQRIRRDAIDILVDLKGYTLYARNGVFAYRAAPVQVNFLGFPGTLGSEHYDYIIGDPVVTPLEHADGYREKIAQLPGCYQPNDRQRPLAAPRPRAAYGLPPDAFVFACFNANYKVTPAVFDRWCALLRRFDDAVLWLFVSNDQARRSLAAAAQARSVAPQRLHWAEPLPQAAHLCRLQAADLFLDTMPVNAHTTASDALWAGLPLVTVTGDTFAARVATSLLHAAGLAELAAADLDGYEDIAASLAQDRGRLAALREHLARQRTTGALFDGVAHARNLEALFERMAGRQAQGLPPEHLPAGAPAPRTP